MIELRISTAEFIVGDIRINVIFMQVLVVGFIREASICGDNNVIVIDVFTKP